MAETVSFRDDGAVQVLRKDVLLERNGREEGEQARMSLPRRREGRIWGLLSLVCIFVVLSVYLGDIESGGIGCLSLGVADVSTVSVDSSGIRTGGAGGVNTNSNFGVSGDLGEVEERKTPRELLPEDAIPESSGAKSETFGEEEIGGSRRLQDPLDLGKIWKYCDGFTPNGFEDINVEINPNPPQAGKWLRVTVSGRIDEPVNRPSIHTLFFLNDVIPVREIRMYCESNDCPVPPGDFSASVRYYIPPFVSGRARGVATVQDEGSEDPLVCVNVGPVPIRSFRWRRSLRDK